MGGVSDEVADNTVIPVQPQPPQSPQSVQIPMSPLAQPPPTAFSINSSRSQEDIYNFDEANEDLEVEVTNGGLVKRLSRNFETIATGGDSTNPLLLTNHNSNVTDPRSLSDQTDNGNGYHSELRNTINNFRSKLVLTEARKIDPKYSFSRWIPSFGHPEKQSSSEYRRGIVEQFPPATAI